MITDGDIVKAICMTNANDKVICENANINRNRIKYAFAYWCWLLLMLFLSPHRKGISNSIICATTHINLKRLMEKCGSNEFYAFAKLNNTPKKIMKNTSFMTNDGFWKRLGKIFSYIVFYVKNHKSLVQIPVPIVVEYCYIADLIKHNSIDTVYISANYDRYSTLITNLSKYANKEVIGIQDGAVIDIELPEKLYYDIVYAFDEYEKHALEKYIDNSMCEYSIIGFSSVIKWKKYHTDRTIIAIASQDWLTDKTIYYAERLYSLLDLDKFVLILYPHYREKKARYKTLKSKCPQIVISENDRYSNIDLLITFFSTIVYDYWSVNPKLPVFCIKVNNYVAEYYKRDNVFLTDDVIEIKRYLMK